MTDEQKIRLADIIIGEMEKSFNGEDLPLMVGVLNKETGIVGFKKAEVGHPVFEYKDRYILYLESETPEKITVPNSPTIYRDFKAVIPYYKETLKPYIDFL